MRSLSLGLLLAASLPMVANAHTPLCSCYDFGDGTVLCEGGFSDGSSASGVEMLVKDGNGNALVKGKINEDGEFEFDKPSGDYLVEFNAGPGHLITINGEDIVE